MKAAAAATPTAASVTVAKDAAAPEVDGGALQLLVPQMTAVEGKSARLLVQSITVGKDEYSVRVPLVTPGRQAAATEQDWVYATQMPV
jgi:hypothetical protein